MDSEEGRTEEEGLRDEKRKMCGKNDIYYEEAVKR